MIELDKLSSGTVVEIALWEQLKRIADALETLAPDLEPGSVKNFIHFGHEGTIEGRVDD